MQLAIDAELDELVAATTPVISRLLRNLPYYPGDYCGCDSPNVTGYAGVRAYLMRTPDRTELHVEGPDGLVRALDNLYGGQYPAIVHKPTHLSLRLS